MLLRSSVLAGMALALTAGASAQEEASEVEQVPETAAAVGDRITVTGSRLRRDEFTSASPIQVVDGELSREIGLISASDLVQQATVAQGQQIDLGLSTSAGLAATDNPSGPGAANINLRNLGVGRTLVMVNGRRLAPAGVRGAPSAPDLNMIPGTLVERVEILLDGASSVYGSDAVAGVVNYILRDNFDGMEFTAYTSYPEMDGRGGRQHVLSGSFGLSTDRGFLGVAVEYAQIDPVTQAQFGSFDQRFNWCNRSQMERGASGRTYDDRCIGSAISHGILVDSPFGFIKRDPSVTGGVAGGRPLPDGWRPVVVAPNVIDRREALAEDLLVYPSQLGTYFWPDFRRGSAFVVGEYEPGWYGNATLYTELSYARRHTTDVGIGQGSAPLDNNNPQNPFVGFLNPDEGPVRILYLAHTNNETIVSQARGVFGVRGDLPFMNAGDFANWSYDLYTSVSHSEGTDIVQGLLARDRLNLSQLNTVFDPASGQFVCDAPIVSPVTGRPACFAADFTDPFFINNGRFEDDDLNEYFFPKRFSYTEFQQYLVNGFVTGDLFNLPAGPVGAVLGFEYRLDRIETQVDRAAFNQELDGDFIDRGASGSRSLTEIFGEVEVPLLANQPFANELTLNLAGRYTSEENFGDEGTYRIQGVWAPNDWLTFRATYGTSFRAPDVGEQFGSQLADQASVRGAGDPCLAPGIAFAFETDPADPTGPELRVYDPDLDPRSPELLDQCRNGGGPFGFAGVDPTILGTSGAGTNNLSFRTPSTIVFEGNNPDLDPETSTAYTYGFVVDRSNLFAGFDFRFSATYFNITVKNQVTETSAVSIVQGCYDGNTPNPTNPLCAFMTRGADGNVATVNAVLQNIGELGSSGIDYNMQISRDFDTPFFDSPVNAMLIWNATQVRTQFRDFAQVRETFVGEYGNPEWRANLIGLVSYRDTRLMWRTRFVDAVERRGGERAAASGFDACVRAGDTPCTQIERAPQYFVHDASATYNRDTWRVTLGVNNVLNETFPAYNGPFRGVGYDTGGRTWFLNLGKAF